MPVPQINSVPFSADDVIAKERDKLEDAKSAYDKLAEQYAKIEAL